MIHGIAKRRQALRQRTQNRHICTRRQIKDANDYGCADHGNQYTGHAFAVPQQQDHRQCACADRERRPVRSSVQNRSGDRQQFPQRSITVDRKAEELGQLADEHRQGYSVHVAIADRLGKKLGHEAEPGNAGKNAYNA